MSSWGASSEESAEDMRQRALCGRPAEGGRDRRDRRRGAGAAQRVGRSGARGQPLVAEYSRQVADGLESLAHWVSRRNVDDVTGGLEDFARQRPVAFIGGAMVAGFALARFMKSSSARRSRTSGSEYGVQAEYGSGRTDRRRRAEWAGTTGTPVRTARRGRGGSGRPRRARPPRHVDAARLRGNAHGPRPPTEGGI